MRQFSAQLFPNLPFFEIKNNRKAPGEEKPYKGKKESKKKPNQNAHHPKPPSPNPIINRSRLDIPLHRPSRQTRRAIHKRRLIGRRNPQHAQLRHGPHKSSIPAPLGADERRPRRTHGGTRVRQVNVRVEAGKGRIRGRRAHLGVEVDVPRSRGGIERVADGDLGLRKDLGGRVRADERGQVRGREALVREEREQRVVVRARAEAGRDEARRRLRGGIRAPDQDGDFGTERAGADGVRGGELHQVGGTDALGLVRVRELVAEEVEIGFETRALRACHLFRIEQQRAVGPSARGGDKGRGEGEGTGVVEGEADGGAGEVRAHAVRTEEAGGQVGGEGGVDGGAGGLTFEEVGDAGFGIAEAGEGEGLRGRGGAEDVEKGGGCRHFWVDRARSEGFRSLLEASGGELIWRVDVRS